MHYKTNIVGTYTHNHIIGLLRAMLCNGLVNSSVGEFKSKDIIAVIYLFISI